jgi:hypothetical protein
MHGQRVRERGVRVGIEARVSEIRHLGLVPVQLDHIRPLDAANVALRATLKQPQHGGDVLEGARVHVERRRGQFADGGSRTGSVDDLRIPEREQKLVRLTACGGIRREEALYVELEVARQARIARPAIEARKGHVDEEVLGALICDPPPLLLVGRPLNDPKSPSCVAERFMKRCSARQLIVSRQTAATGYEVHKRPQQFLIPVKELFEARQTRCRHTPAVSRGEKGSATLRAAEDVKDPWARWERGSLERLVDPLLQLMLVEEFLEGPPRRQAAVAKRIRSCDASRLCREPRADNQHLLGERPGSA